MEKSLTTIILTKNEEGNIDDCIKSLTPLRSEIIVIDAGSTDKTKEIAQMHQIAFIEHKNWQGFGKQRQIAQAYVKTDWVLWIDADERLTPELCAEINATILTATTNTLYEIPRLSWVFGRFIKHSGWYPDYVTRLYPTRLTTYNDSLVHEKVIIPKKAKCIKLKNPLHHYTYHNLRHYLEKSAYYASLWADDKKNKGKTSNITQGILHALACFIKMYIIKAGVLDGKQGLLLALLSAHSTFVKYADLWIKTKTKSAN